MRIPFLFQFIQGRPNFATSFTALYVITSHFVITIAICNKVVTFCNKSFNPFYKPCWAQYVISSLNVVNYQRFICRISTIPEGHVKI